MIKYFILLLITVSFKINSFPLIVIPKNRILKKSFRYSDLYVYESYKDGFLVLGTDNLLENLKENNISYKKMYDNEEDYLKRKKSVISNESFVKYDEVVENIDKLVSKYPHIIKKIIIGKSVEGRDIVGIKTILNEYAPKYRIVGGIHGNEAQSYQFVFDFMIDLIENNKKYKEILNNTQIYIIPMLNPDGAVNVTRRNLNNVDLNRNMCFFWKESMYSSGNCFNQPESRALRDFTLKENFTMSFSFHTFGDIINYVWNFSPDNVHDIYEILNISNIYKKYTKYEVTEGYFWYQTIGDLNDYSYGVASTLDWTIEIDDSDKKGDIYKSNKEALINILRTYGLGIEGTVTDMDGKPLKASIVIDEGSVFYNYDNGYFYRYALNGYHSIRVVVQGYEIYEDFFYVDNNKSFLNVKLKKSNDEFLFTEKIISLKAKLPKYGYQNVSMPENLLFKPDGFCFKLPKNAEILLKVPKFKGKRALKIIEKYGLNHAIEISGYEGKDEESIFDELYQKEQIEIDESIKYIKIKSLDFELCIDAVLYENKYHEDKIYKGSSFFCDYSGKKVNFLSYFWIFVFVIVSIIRIRRNFE